MKINLFNKNVDNARFEIRWGKDKSTPAIILEPGDTASFDMDIFNQIPEGAEWWVKGYEGNKKAIHSSKKFKYINGYGYSGTFKLAKKDRDLAFNLRKCSISLKQTGLLAIH